MAELPVREQAKFDGIRKTGPNGQQYVDPASLEYVEAGQLTYTLTRPDVYNAIMAFPGLSHELERELGADTSKGMDSYDDMLTYEAITVDSRDRIMGKAAYVGRFHQ